MNDLTAAQWHFAAKARDVEEDEPLLVFIGELQIALCRLGGAIYAIHNICTHEYACLSDGFIEGDQIECPLHQARFHIPTGKALTAPATEDVRIFPVRQEGDDVYVGVAEG